MIGCAHDIFACQVLAANTSHRIRKLDLVMDVVTVRDSTRIELLMSELTHNSDTRTLLNTHAKMFSY